jgi:hypothetical protein
MDGQDRPQDRRDLEKGGVVMLVDRALRALFSVGTGAVSGLLRWGSQRLSDVLSGQPAQPGTTVADVIGEATPEGQQQTIAFGLDGQAYEIDLDADHAGALRSILQRYIDAGRRIGEQPTAPATTGSVRPRRSAASAQQNDPAAIRAWARAKGHPVSDRGRIPAPVLEAYEAAQQRSRRSG